MAEGARARTRSTYALATTGVAGQPAVRRRTCRTVYVALASAKNEVEKLFFRLIVRRSSSLPLKLLLTCCGRKLFIN